jgi:hypothetical protein
MYYSFVDCLVQNEKRPFSQKRMPRNRALPGTLCINLYASYAGGLLQPPGVGGIPGLSSIPASVASAAAAVGGKSGAEYQKKLRRCVLQACEKRIRVGYKITYRGIVSEFAQKTCMSSTENHIVMK